MKLEGSKCHMDYGLGGRGVRGRKVSCRGPVISGSSVCGAECPKVWDLSPSGNRQPWSAPASRMSGPPGRLSLAFQISRQRSSPEGLEGAWCMQSSCLSGRPRASPFSCLCKDKESGPWRSPAGLEVAVTSCTILSKLYKSYRLWFLLYLKWE